MPQHYLEWTAPDGRRQVQALEKDELVIGRSATSDIVIDNPFVSRQHAKLKRSERGYVLVDLSSSHGSFVNGCMVTRQDLTPGDCIKLGLENVEFHYRDQSASIPAPAVVTEEATLKFDLDRSLANLSEAYPPQQTPRSELEKLNLVLDLQYNLGREFSAAGTFQKILHSALQLSGAERGFILLKTLHGWDYILGMNATGQNLEESEFVHASRTVVTRVAANQEAIFMTGGIDGSLANQASILAMQIRAVACLPIKWITAESAEPEVRGILYLDSTKAMHTLSGLDEKILRKLAQEVTAVFEKVEMIKALEEKRKVEIELELARETQENLLPESLPQLSGFNLEAFCRPTYQVGGDFYDFIEPPSGGLMGILADVSGKGVSAALLSSLLQGALDMELRSRGDIASALKEVNSYLCERTGADRFATVFLFHIDQQGSGKFVSAGHNPIYLWRADGGEVEELMSGHRVLGAFEDVQYDARPVEIRRGDLMVVYSDGLTEAEDPLGRMFGENRLQELVKRSAAGGAQAVREDILTTLEFFTKGRAQTDDITFLILQRRP